MRLIWLLMTLSLKKFVFKYITFHVTNLSATSYALAILFISTLFEMERRYSGARYQLCACPPCEVAQSAEVDLWLPTDPIYRIEWGCSTRAWYAGANSYINRGGFVMSPSSSHNSADSIPSCIAPRIIRSSTGVQPVAPCRLACCWACPGITRKSAASYFADLVTQLIQCVFLHWAQWLHISNGISMS